MIEITIFTRWENKKLKNLLYDLSKQNTKLDIKIYSDENKKLKNYETIYTNNINIAWKRNLAIQNCKEEYLFLLDDDNRVYDKDFFNKLLEKYKKVQKVYKKSIISPIIYYKDTNIIQSAGINFCYFLWKVCARKKIKWEFQETEWVWGNSLFWKTEYFKKNKFDKNIGFIGEDIDYIYWLREQWVKIFIVNQKINHMERDKTRVEKSFVSWKNMFRKKIKNRNIFVKKHWNLLQKICYYLLWYWLWIIYWKILQIIENF